MAGGLLLALAMSTTNVWADPAVWLRLARDPQASDRELVSQPLLVEVDGTLLGLVLPSVGGGALLQLKPADDKGRHRILLSTADQAQQFCFDLRIDAKGAEPVGPAQTVACAAVAAEVTAVPPSSSDPVAAVHMQFKLAPGRNKADLGNCIVRARSFGPDADAYKLRLIAPDDADLYWPERPGSKHSRVIKRGPTPKKPLVVELGSEPFPVFFKKPNHADCAHWLSVYRDDGHNYLRIDHEETGQQELVPEVPDVRAPIVRCDLPAIPVPGNAPL
jgi:hypothetical protein